MSQHTPGPWRIARDTYGVERIWGPEDESVACTVGDGFIDDAERKANTQLIKAAPTLLASCKELVNMVGPDHPAVARARTAIAEAEGHE